ncbi:hypothetical protein PIB30_042218 [Stylosanthes scabra]|uniref:Uncharacterized protein n=1 Tax=Stylosanthes scabra TaxID=79078 RepID=A0ABU6WDL0_9FABA|nr:hypothetical protein [Stylosanthes scabra]
MTYGCTFANLRGCFLRVAGVFSNGYALEALPGNFLSSTKPTTTSPRHPPTRSRRTAASEPVHISSHQRCWHRRSIVSKSLVAVLKVEEVSAAVVSASRPSHPPSHPVVVDLAGAPSHRRCLGSVSIQRRRILVLGGHLQARRSLQSFVFVFHLRLQVFVSAVHGLQCHLIAVVAALS